MRQIMHRYWKHLAFVGALFLVFFAAQAGRITRGPEQVSKQPVPVRIIDPVEYVRGFLCLPLETLGECEVRVP